MLAVNACQSTEEVVMAHDPKRALPVSDERSESAFRHLMNCRPCKERIPPDARGQFVSAYVLDLH
jgi:hypothetical protein